MAKKFNASWNHLNVMHAFAAHVQNNLKQTENSAPEMLYIPTMSYYLADRIFH